MTQQVPLAMKIALVALLLMALSSVLGMPARAAGPQPAIADAATHLSSGFEQHELTAADGTTDGFFGAAVALDGRFAVIGNPGNTGNPLSKERVYVFERTSSGWTQRAELAAADGVLGDGFGTSVALGQGTILVGAPNKEQASGESGAIYVFPETASGFVQSQLELVGPRTSASFGYAIAISGNTALFGAPHEGISGAAYVSTFVRGAWSQPQPLATTASTAGGEFGWSVAINGETAVVGAPQDTLQGAVYVFQRTATGWTQQQRLAATDAAFGDGLGTSVALKGAIIMAGAPDKQNYSGAVYVYARSRTGWAQQATVVSQSPAPYAYFGQCVALGGRGTVAVIGAFGTNNFMGEAEVFARSLFSATWTGLGAPLTPGDQAQGDAFGASCALGATGILVGAPETNTATGAADLFTPSGQGINLGDDNA
jgi:hypothetical protein